MYLYLNIFLVIVLGLAVGSFLGSFSFRFPKRISIVKGRSFCPKCKSKISWFDNIPVFSYLMLNAKCRSCKEKISLRYPFIEIFSSIFFLLIYLHFQTDLFKVILYCFFYFLAAAVTIIDLEEGIIPDEFVFVGVGIAFFYVLFFKNANSFEHLFGGFALGLFMLCLHLLTKGKGMGLGDVKFTLFPAIYFLFPYNLLWLFLSFILGSIIGIILIIMKKAKFGKEIPFGPFLAISFIIIMIWGDPILKCLIKYLY